MNTPVAKRNAEDAPAVAETVPIMEARVRLSELVNRAAFGGERIVITRNGKPVAVISGAAA